MGDDKLLQWTATRLRRIIIIFEFNPHGSNANFTVWRPYHWKVGDPPVGIYRSLFMVNRGTFYHPLLPKEQEETEEMDCSLPFESVADDDDFKIEELTTCKAC